MANVNTTHKNFVPFGAFGTVVGFTLDAVVVMFDEQNLALKNIFEVTGEYRGAELSPESLINLSRMKVKQQQQQQKQ